MTSYRIQHLGANHYVLHMYESNVYVGYINYNMITFDSIFVNHIEIFKMYRGNGFGRKLVLYLLNYYFKGGLHGVWRNDDARKFWNKFLPTESGRSFTIGANV